MDLFEGYLEKEIGITEENDSDCGRCIWKHRITMNLIQTFERGNRPNGRKALCLF